MPILRSTWSQPAAIEVSLSYFSIYVTAPFAISRTLSRLALRRYFILVLEYSSTSIALTMSPPKIAIIGAGPAGLMLARLLQHNSIPCTVYEKEKDRHARTQGGSLDLHEGSAQLALKEAGLYEDFLKVAYPDGEVLKIYTPEGKVLLDENEKFGVGRPEQMKNRPEIDRVKLRELLLDSLDSKTVQWGRRLLRVEETSDNRYNLHFEGITETGLDVVVGADGAWSKVRSLLSDTKPFYAGVTGLDVTIVDADNRSPAEAKRVGGGMCLTIGKDRGILAQRNGNGTIRTYAFVRCPEFWHKECEIDWTQPEAAKHAMIDTHYPDWDQGAKDMILKSDEDIVVRPMYMLPIGFKWEHRTG